MLRIKQQVSYLVRYVLPFLLGLPSQGLHKRWLRLQLVKLYDQLHQQWLLGLEQMRVKDRQIAEKDKQLDQQQQLTAKAMNERETLLLELDEAKEKVQAQEQKGFFARLFGR